MRIRTSHGEFLNGEVNEDALKSAEPPQGGAAEMRVTKDNVLPPCPVSAASSRNVKVVQKSMVSLSGPGSHPLIFTHVSGAQMSDFHWLFVLVLRPKGSTRTRARRSQIDEYEYEYHFIEYEYEDSEKRG
jgi:hypothetical protein